MRRPRPPLALLAPLLAIALSALSASADDGGWAIISPQPGISPAPNQHVSVFVPARNQIIAYGGNLGADTWVLDVAGNAWSVLNASNRPPARLAASAIYDPVHDQMVMFGGYGGLYLDELWILSLSGIPTWTQVTPSGAWPPARNFACAVYDPVRGRMILFSGFSGATYNDVWALDLATMTWSQLTPSGAAPSARYGAVAVYDPVNDRMVITFGATGDTWALSLAGSPSWTQLHPTGTIPPNRQFSAAVYDADGQRMVIHGGKQGNNSYPDSWELTLGATPNWRQLSPSGTPATARWEHTAMVDPARHRMYVLGGNGTSDLRSLTWPPGLAPAAISSVVPSSGNEGDPVTINGFSLDNATSVTFNGVSAPILGNTSTTIATMVPTGAMTGPVQVSTPAGIALSPTSFTVLYTPEVTSFTPAEAEVGADVTITGRFLSGVTQVVFGTGQAAPFTIVSDTEIIATVNGSATTGPILVSNLYGTVATATSFVVDHHQPSVSSISPTSGHAGDIITINGRYLSQTVTVRFSGDTPTQFIALSDTVVNATVSTGAMTGPITLTTPYGSTATPTFTRVTTRPIISSVSPASARRGETIHIFGQYLGNATHVSFGGPSSSASFTVVSDGELLATLDPAATTGPITIQNPDGATASSFNFQVLFDLPVIISATPTSGKVGDLIVIAGSRLSGSSRVAFGPNSYAAFTVVSDAEIHAVVDAGAATAPITITNANGSTASGFTFTVISSVGPPQIVAVRDAPNDQGGKVILEWLASALDIGGGHTINDYRIWRRAPPSAPASGRVGPWMSLPDGYWEPIGDVPAVRFPGYAFTAPTLQDSVPGANLLTSFMVEAMTSDPATYYFSAPDSGYSVDNLAPPYPASLIAAYSESSARLSWSRSPAPDLAVYRIYRGSTVSFAADSAHFLAVTTDTTYLDDVGGQAYELIAVDKHGGMSKAAVVSPSEPSAALIRTQFPQTEPDHIQLSWIAEAQPGLAATLYRRSAGSDWARITDLRASPAGVLSYTDRAVATGASYDYQLGVVDAGVEEMFGAISAAAAAPRLAILGIRPNPSVGGVSTVDLQLSSDQPAQLELLDITGRRVLVQELAPTGPGRREVALAPHGALPPGIYFVRVHQAARSGTLRMVVLN